MREKLGFVLALTMFVVLMVAPATSFAHIGCIDENDQTGFEGAQLTGNILRRYTGIYDKQAIHILRALFLAQSTRHHGPGGIIAIKFVANAYNRQTQRSVQISLAVSQQLAERVLPGIFRHLRVYHNKE